TSHEKELRESETRIKLAADARYGSQMAEENSRHEQTVTALQAEILASNNEITKLLKGISGLLNAPVSVNSFQDQIEDLLSQKQDFSDKYSELIDENEELLRQLEAKGCVQAGLERQVTILKQKATQQEAKVNELAHLVANNEDALKESEALIKKKDAIIDE